MSASGLITLKTDEEIEKMAELGSILAVIVEKLGEATKVGVSPIELDNLAEELCTKYEVNPSCKGFEGYPSATCIGINSQAVHNIPSATAFRKGDIVSIDMVIDRDGWFVDHAITVPVGKIDERGRELISLTKKALDDSIKKVKAGARIGDIGATIESTVKPAGFDVLYNMVGHGIGRSMHENPQVPCFGTPGEGEEIVEGMVFTIEPMISEKSSHLVTKEDGWSTYLKDGGRFAMFEHTLALTEQGVKILTKKS